MKFKLGKLISDSLSPGKTKKGLLISYGIFLLFSSLLLLTYMVSNIAVVENDVYSVILSVERVRNQFDAIEYHYLRLPVSELNFSINGSSVIFTETLPFPITNETSTSFFVFKEFVENYSLINTTFDAVPELPGELQISPQNITVIHPDEYTLEILPLDSNSAATLESYVIYLEVQGSTPTVEWHRFEEVSPEDENAVFFSVTANGTGDPQRLNTLSGYVDRTKHSDMHVKRGNNNIMKIRVGKDDEGKLIVELDKKFSAALTTEVTFNSTITETIGGQKPANATVTIANVLKRNEIVK